jgi:hypothetical protein
MPVARYGELQLSGFDLADRINSPRVVAPARLRAFAGRQHIVRKGAAVSQVVIERIANRFDQFREFTYEAPNSDHR